MTVESLILSDGDVAGAFGYIYELRNINHGQYDNDIWASIDHLFNAWGAKGLYSDVIGDNIISGFLGGLAGLAGNSFYIFLKRYGITVAQDDPLHPPSYPTEQQWWWGQRGIVDPGFWTSR